MAEFWTYLDYATFAINKAREKDNRTREFDFFIMPTDKCGEPAVAGRFPHGYLMLKLLSAGQLASPLSR